MSWAQGHHPSHLSDACPVVLAFGGPGPAPPHAFLGSWPQEEHHVKNQSEIQKSNSPGITVSPWRRGTRRMNGCVECVKDDNSWGFTRHDKTVELLKNDPPWRMRDLWAWYVQSCTISSTHVLANDLSTSLWVGQNMRKAKHRKGERCGVFGQRSRQQTVFQISTRNNSIEASLKHVSFLMHLTCFLEHFSLSNPPGPLGTDVDPKVQLWNQKRLTELHRASPKPSANKEPILMMVLSVTDCTPNMLLTARSWKCSIVQSHIERTWGMGKSIV